jgi:hypothetical protein
MLSLETKIKLLDLAPYFLLAFIGIILFIYLYIRAKFGFWSYQPVFHVYDFLYYIWNKGIIQPSLPKPNKFTNFDNIVTIDFKHLTELKKNDFSHFIQIHYFREKNNFYDPKRNNIDPHFVGFNDPCYISFYREKNLLNDTKRRLITEQKKNIGVISSRPLHVLFTNSKAQIKAYYVDFLCIDRSRRKQGLASQLIQTHHFNQSHGNKNIVVSIFKREDELTGIVPICVYKTYGFPVLKWRQPSKLSAEYTIIEANSLNYHLFSDFIKSSFSLFDLCIFPDEGNTLELMKTKNIFIFGVLEDHEIKAIYCYRKTCVFVEKGMEVLNCFASINQLLPNDVFIHGFKNTFWETANKYNFGYCSIESIGHNEFIIENLKKKTQPEIISPTAYFFYNFIYNPISSTRCLVLV